MKRAGLMAAAVLAAGTAWAGAFDAARVPAGATWVVHADLSALRPTPMGQFLVNELGSGVAGNKRVRRGPDAPPFCWKALRERRWMISRQRSRREWGCGPHSSVSHRRSPMRAR